MPTKTDRILSYLPGTFRALPKPSALHSVVEAFGGELLQAENSLAAMMMAHWVDHADRNAELIQDLACIASLYGLRPRGADAPREDAGENCEPVAADESVEEFREHLKRFVRTFLDGTATVQGNLRIAAEALGLHINDEYADLDAWWTRASNLITEIVRRGDDAALYLFGFAKADVQGHSAQPAKLVGRIGLVGEIDLGAGAALLLKVDNAEAVKIDLPARAKLSDIISTINNALAAKVPDHTSVASLVASGEGDHLALASPTIGSDGRLELLETSGDAAMKLFNLPPRSYHGLAATAAHVASLHFDAPIDLSTARYLRLQIDGKLTAEIDCAAGKTNLKQIKLDDIAKAINDAFSKAALGAAGLETEIAKSLNGVLTLTSPTVGAAIDIKKKEHGVQPLGCRLS